MLQLKPAAWVEGTVYRGGTPWRGVPVSVDGEGLMAITDLSGRYRLGPLAAGSRGVVAVTLPQSSGHPEQVQGVRELSLANGQVRTLDFGGTGVLEGEVRAPISRRSVEVAIIPGRWSPEQLNSKAVREATDLYNTLVRLRCMSCNRSDNL